MTRPLPALLLLAGLAPWAAWQLGAALGWGPDVQVLSGTLDPADPTGSAFRGLLLIGCWMVAAITGPPLVVGSASWWLWRRLSPAPQRVTVPSG